MLLLLAIETSIAIAGTVMYTNEISTCVTRGLIVCYVMIHNLMHNWLYFPNGALVFCRIG